MISSITHDGHTSEAVGLYAVSAVVVVKEFTRVVDAAEQGVCV